MAFNLQNGESFIPLNLSAYSIIGKLYIDRVFQLYKR